MEEVILTKISRKIARVERNEKGQLQKGSILNPTGKLPGTNNFETDFNDAVAEIAELNKITSSEARKILFKVAFTEARKGNYNFYRDTIDRIYGKALEKMDLTTKGEKLPTPIIPQANLEKIKNEFEEKLNEALQIKILKKSKKK